MEFTKDEVFSAPALYAWLEFCYGASKYHILPPSCDPCHFYMPECENCDNPDKDEPDLTVHMRVHQLAVTHNEPALAGYALQRFKDEEIRIFEGDESWRLHDSDYLSELFGQLVSQLWLQEETTHSSRYQELVANFTRLTGRLCRSTGQKEFDGEEKAQILGALSKYPSPATDLVVSTLCAEWTRLSIGRDREGLEEITGGEALCYNP
jgi:hypothetical protein